MMTKSLKLALVAAVTAALFAATVARATDPRFVLEDVAGDVTVIDDQTNLEWQRAPQIGLIWVNALAHCDTLDYGGHDDWRLPNVMELSSIIDEIESSPPAINTTFFDGTWFDALVVWTSTTNPKNSVNAYIVRFNDDLLIYARGGVYTQGKGVASLALCVRSYP